MQHGGQCHLCLQNAGGEAGAGRSMVRPLRGRWSSQQQRKQALTPSPPHDRASGAEDDRAPPAGCPQPRAARRNAPRTRHRRSRIPADHQPGPSPARPEKPSQRECTEEHRWPSAGAAATTAAAPNRAGGPPAGRSAPLHRGRSGRPPPPRDPRAAAAPPPAEGEAACPGFPPPPRCRGRTGPGPRPARPPARWRCAARAGTRPQPACRRMAASCAAGQPLSNRT